MISIQPERVRVRNKKPIHTRGRFVLYWMQQSQRADSNHALEYAVYMANEQRKPLQVFFGLTPTYPEANLRHYVFMLEGLADTHRRLARRGIPLQVAVGQLPQTVLDASAKATMIICDSGYLRHQRQWRRVLAQKTDCPLIEIESDAIVPVQNVSTKAEYAARTIRPKIHRLLPHFMVPLKPLDLKHPNQEMAEGPDFTKLLQKLRIDRSVPAVSDWLPGGYTAGRECFRQFIKTRLTHYHTRRNHPETDSTSVISPYLHFGQISSLELALAVSQPHTPPDASAAFLEELIVRRELAINYVYFNPDYDRYSGLPRWARQTLSEHRADRRKPIYRLEDLDSAATADPYWNTSMAEMKHTGYMHGYMRMYWGKKIIEWLPDPQEAFTTILHLNNKFFIDGRDPNSYAGVGWLFGLHDRPWKERPVFGKVRYMARSGLERKFDMQGYMKKIRTRIGRLAHNDSR